MIFEADDMDTCQSCGDTRMLDIETQLCKECWREWRNEQEGGDRD